MAWRKCMLWLPFMLLLGATLGSLGRISYSAAVTTIRVDPPMLFAEAGEHFYVNLTITSAVDVYSWQANVRFDGFVVQVVNATLPPDHFLEGRPMGTTGLSYNPAGSNVLVACSIMGAYEGMHGSGTLVTLEFEIIGAGESVLKIDEGDWTFLMDSNIVETTPGPDLKTEDGYVSNVDCPPTASFTFSPSEPDLNDTITFNASSSYDPDGHIIRYEWDFGDGSIANETGAITTHDYTVAKVYTVTLIVIDNAIATQKIMDTFNTTTVPHLWYESHSFYSATVKFKLEHDVAVVSVSASPSRVTVGESVAINVTVENQGKATETFDVVVYYDGNTMTTRTVESLVPDDSETLDITWATTDITPDTYVIKAEATLEGDADSTNNIYVDGTIRVDEPETPFPMEYIIIGIVVVVIVIGVAVFLVRRK